MKKFICFIIGHDWYRKHKSYIKYFDIDVYCNVRECHRCFIIEVDY